MLSQVSGFQTLPKSFSSFHAPDYVIFRISEQKNEEIEYENTKSKVTVDRVHNKKKKNKTTIPNQKRKKENEITERIRVTTRKSGSKRPIFGSIIRYIYLVFLSKYIYIHPC